MQQPRYPSPLLSQPGQGVIDTNWAGDGVVLSDGILRAAPGQHLYPAPGPSVHLHPVDAKRDSVLEETADSGPDSSLIAVLSGRTLEMRIRSDWSPPGFQVDLTLPDKAGRPAMRKRRHSRDAEKFRQKPQGTARSLHPSHQSQPQGGQGVSATQNDGQTRGMQTEAAVAAGLAARTHGRQKMPWRDSWRGPALKARFRAAGVHLGVSVLIACLVLGLVYEYWYVGPLAAVAGVGTILVLLLAVDVSLGPIMTFMVFDRRKKSLPADLALIGVLQLVALCYGLHTVEAGRPHYLVFVKDRFEAVSKADLQAEDLEKARGNPSAMTAMLGPVWAASKAPDDDKSRQDVLIESAMGGRDLQHFPQWYEPLANQREGVRTRALDLEMLRKLNPEGLAVLEDAVRQSGMTEAQLGYLPLKGEETDASVLVSRDSGTVLEILPLKPW